MREALHLEENERRAPPRIEISDAGFERKAKRMVRGRSGEPGRLAGLACRGDLDGPPAPPAQHVVTGIHEHAVDPRREPRGSAKRRGAAIDLEERLLHRVLRVGEVAQKVRRDALHSRPVELVEAFEGRDLACAALLEQRQQAFVGAHDRECERHALRAGSLDHCADIVG